jgi:hypothetical protein
VAGLRRSSAPINPLWCVSASRSVLVAGEKAVL